MHLFNPSAKMPSGPKKRRAAAKKKKALENLNTNHVNNFQEINTNPDSTSAVNENTAVVMFSAIPTADSSDHSPKEDVPRDELNEGVKLVMKENDTASFVPAAFSVDLPDAAGDLPKDGLSFIDKDMIADAIALAGCIPEGTVESNEDSKQDLKENDMKFEFAENLLKEAIHVEFNEDSNLGFKPNDSTILPSVDDKISLTSTVALSTDADLNLTMEKVANLVPENPDENSKFPLPMDPSVEEDCEKAFESPNDFDIFNQNYTSEHQLEGTVESNEDFKQDLKENDMKFEFAENLPKEAIHVEFNEDSKLGFKPNDSSMLPSVDDQIPLTSTVALPTDTDLNLTMEKVATLVPENPDESSKFTLPMDPSVEEDYEKAFESPNDFDIFNQNYTSELQLEHFKKKVIDELKATDKMRAFLQKVLDDLNLMQLSGSGTSFV